MMRLEFRKRFGKRWRARFNDFRNARRPGDVHRRATRAPLRPAGQAARGRERDPRPRLDRALQPADDGLGRRAGRRDRAVGPARVRASSAALPHHASNGVVVGSRYSKTGRPLWAAGPQVDYWSPQIFVEYELHGGGLDGTGVTFPGASPWPLIGHGIDFAWSGTSANGDNQDTFVEWLCEPDGSEPTAESRSYMYKGECTPFRERDVTVTTPPPSAGNMSPQEEITYHPLRSVHGPVFAFATVDGKPVALTKAKGVNFRELDAVLPFMHVAENQPTDYKSFVRDVQPVPGDRELVLRRQQARRLHAVRLLPRARARRRRRPPLQRRRQRRLAGLRPLRLHATSTSRCGAARSAVDSRAADHHQLEPEGGARLAQGPDRVEQRLGAPRRDPQPLGAHARSGRAAGRST